MIYGSVCSGIEAATVAWEPLGWSAAWFAEIAAFPSAVLTHHYPGVPNLGDFTMIGAEHGAIELLVGGTPCQSFSVAGRRAGLDDPRGVLAFEFLALAHRVRPRWILFENVPGLLSSNQGRDFGAWLGALAECGYGFAYRVLDAQYFGVPQRRRRVFVVGYLGDWRPPAAVLFERACLSGDITPRREAREGAAGSLGGGAGERGSAPDTDRMTFVPARCDTARGKRLNGAEDTFVVNGNSTPEVGDDMALPLRHADGSGNRQAIVLHENQRAEVSTNDTMGALKVGGGKPGQEYPAIAYSTKLHNTHSNQAGKFYEDYTASLQENSPAPAVVAFDWQAGGSGDTSFRGKGRGYTVRKGEYTGALQETKRDAIAFNWQSGGDVRLGLTREQTTALHASQKPAMQESSGMLVRRLTPLECERLQGFPDDWTRVPYRGKSAEECPDGPRYAALGNSMAVPVIRWLGERIALVDALKQEA